MEVSRKYLSPESDKVPAQEHHEDYQNEAREVFQKLCLWREESHKQLSDIIDAHNTSLIKGINDLVERVDELQTELMVIKKERNVLLETVDHLNIEIRHHGAQIPNADPPDKHSQHDIQAMDSSEVEVPNTIVQDIESQIIKDEPDYEDSLEHNQSDQNIIEHSNNHATSDGRTEVPGTYDDQRRTKKDGTKSKDGTSNQKKDAYQAHNPRKGNEEFVCPECSFAFSTSYNLRVHLKNVHPTMEVVEEIPSDDDLLREHSDPPRTEDKVALTEMKIASEDSLLETNKRLNKNERFRCEQCPYGASRRCDLNRHIKVVHDKIRNHACEECDYTTSSKGDLDRHRRTMHKRMKNHACEECDYTASDKGNLNKHIKAVHDRIKNHACEECNYTASCKGSMDKHIRRVHIRIKNHVCEECDFAAIENNELRRHKLNIHNTGENKLKKFKCGQCPYTTAHKGRLEVHINGVHKNIRNHVCDVCEKGFTNLTNLKTHKDSVHKMGKKFKCELCSFETYLKHSFGNHAKTVHQIN